MCHKLNIIVRAKYLWYVVIAKKLALPFIRPYYSVYSSTRYVKVFKCTGRLIYKDYCNLDKLHVETGLQQMLG